MAEVMAYYLWEKVIKKHCGFALGLSLLSFFLWSFAQEKTMVGAALLRDLHDESVKPSAHRAGTDPTWYEYGFTATACEIEPEPLS